MRETQFLGRHEVRAVIEDLHRRAKRSIRSKCNLAIFRLACCCGLRVSEIRGLNCGDLRLYSPRPDLRVRKETTKGQKHKRRARFVPLWWDKGTLKDLRDWAAVRESQGAGRTDPFICGQFDYAGERLARGSIADRWRTAIRVLGPERVKQLSIHSGRHTFCTHALAAGRTLAEVKAAAGHTCIGSTNIYIHFLHVLNEDSLPDVFA